MKVETFVLGPIETNCYVLISGGEAAVIDPASGGGVITGFLRENKAELSAIIYTHAHWDHTAGSLELREIFPRPRVFMGINETVMFDDPVFSDYVTESGILPVRADMLLSEGDTLTVGEETLKVLETPGHTPGGISLLIGKYIFTGDALFRSSVGRTDFPGSSGVQLINSIKSRILVLDDNVEVFPGHGPPTTVGWEKRNNPFLI